MTTTTKTANQQTYAVCCTGTTIPFDGINEPGCYVCSWSGHLLRVPPDGVAPGRSPLCSMIGRETLFVTKLHEDPYIPVTKARMLAADWDLAVNF